MKAIYINLSVKDLKKSIEFYSKLGFSSDSKMTSEHSSKMIFEENIFLMLHTKQKFADFSPKKIADSSTSMQTVLAIPYDSKDGVEEMYKKAITSGAKEALELKDYGFMYMRTFEDIDGHIWELYWSK